MSTNPKLRPNDDEIDLIPLLQSLWVHKLTILTTTVAGSLIALSASTVTPDQWTASTYITRSSLYNLYKEINNNMGSAHEDSKASELRLYNSIQNDLFYTAMGVMASQSITLKETTPKTGKNEPILYIVSATATTSEHAAGQLKAALNSANKEAISLNLPALGGENTVRAFNTLDEVKIINSKSPKKLTALGAFLGFLLGSTFVIGRFLIRQYKNTRVA
ncbi:Wzz/FepE/Etk N-terminal domain-containing protein [Pseudomonas kairouanensis]|nr:Wzz/FepE/Etk N-terminal domain-containing protein [Pseudomonas kairouanensis]